MQSCVLTARAKTIVDQQAETNKCGMRCFGLCSSHFLIIWNNLRFIFVHFSAEEVKWAELQQREPGFAQLQVPYVYYRRLRNLDTGEICSVLNKCLFCEHETLKVFMIYLAVDRFTSTDNSRITFLYNLPLIERLHNGWMNFASKYDVT